MDYPTLLEKLIADLNARWDRASYRTGDYAEGQCAAYAYVVNQLTFLMEKMNQVEVNKLEQLDANNSCDQSKSQK